MPKPKTSPSALIKTPAKASPTPPVQSHAIRETVESIVIAFVLAFLFRTFEAEAFVIPTGSMAPTLMGRHKDVLCPKCNYRYQVSASEEESEDPSRRPPSDCVAGKCPMCQYVMPMRPDLPEGTPERALAEKQWREAHPDKATAIPTAKDLAAYIPWQNSYNGDRILVNKYLYTLSDPKRWDVVVFKFPGDAKINYIKRLVGLPGEKLRIDQGDIYVSTDGKDYEITRKPPVKILSMRQLVHDTDFDPAELDAVGWPLRWHSSPDAGPTAWKLDKSIKGNNVRQVYSVAAASNSDSWLRYEHLAPSYEVWQEINAASPSSSNSLKYSTAERAKWRRLIMDSNPYDGRVDRNHTRSFDLRIDPSHEGLHWVSDLMLEADVKIESAEGELILDLVQAGKHFTCRIDLRSGEARLSAGSATDYAKAKTALAGTGSHRIAFSNFDKQLLLWIDGKVVEFDSSTAYDAEQILGNRESRIPRTSASDLGDLAPAGIGARGAKLTVDRLQVWRDLYYIASSNQDFGFQGGAVTDFAPQFDERIFKLSTSPELWDLFKKRKYVDFALNQDQLFVMGDNSAESSDARLWSSISDRGSKPGGPYLDRRLLIGKALCVYWPHSWNQIPGTPIPFPLFPNIADMRLVK